jgi:hypothetical protein
MYLFTQQLYIINKSKVITAIAIVIKFINSFILKYNFTFNCSWYLPLCIYVNKISVEFYWFNNIPDPDLSIIDLVLIICMCDVPIRGKVVFWMTLVSFVLIYNLWRKYITTKRASHDTYKLWYLQNKTE